VQCAVFACAKPAKNQESIMSSVAKVIEITSSSAKSIEDAVETGIQRADKSLDHVESAWVQDIKCVVKNGKVAEWRVNMKVTFLLKD
jgi:dodecin